MKSIGFGFGKIIFFGEHFVLYGVPAIACPINQKTFITIEKSDFFHSFVDHDLSLQEKVIEKFLSLLKIDDKNFAINLSSDLIPSAGLGYSASFCVACARALNSYFDLQFCDQRINELAFEGEKIFHGNPSGVDNTVSTFGKSILFEKKDPVSIENLKIKNSLKIVVAYSDEYGSTKEAIEKVARFKRVNEEIFKSYLVEASDLVALARIAFEVGDVEKIGSLMNQNQNLLSQIGVSTQKLDYLVDIVINCGALGAKITGSGLGGCIIALAKDDKDQNKICLEFEKNGYHCFMTTIARSHPFDCAPSVASLPSSLKL